MSETPDVSDAAETPESARPAPARLTRRELLGAAAAATGGAVAGGAAVSLWDHRRPRSPFDVVTEDDIDVGDRSLRNAIELAGATNSGHGIHRIIWSIPVSEKVMALTFDDGPDERFTPRILDTLERYGIAANFNCMGFNAERNPDLMRRHAARGDEVGNHTMTHKDLGFETAEGIDEEIRSAKEVIEEITGIPTTLFRPPRGVMTGRVADVTAMLGYDIFLWTAMVTNPVGTRRRDIVAKARRGFEPGALISMHDGIGRGTFDPGAPFAMELAAKREQEIKALPAIIEAGLDDGYEWVTAGDMLRVAGSERVAGS